MLGGSTKKVIDVGRSQILGLSAQIIAAAPIIVISIFFARTIGLAAVADFTLLIGISSVAFTLGMIGLRSRLVLDHFRNFAEVDYFGLRVVATFAMALVILTAGLAVSAPPVLTITVMFLRIGDAALDLVMAVDQVRRKDREHMYGYLKGSVFKLVLILLALLVSELIGTISIFSAFACAAVLHAFYAWILLLSRRAGKKTIFGSKTLITIFRLMRHSAVFAVAQIICAVLTSAPRLALPTMADRELAGAAGVALSVSTFLGMAYFAVWLRWMPRFGKDGLNARKTILFVVEMTIGLIAMLMTLWAIGAPVVGTIFALTEPAYLEMALLTLMASAIFFFVMTLANLFKPTRLPWAESFVYLGGLAGATFVILPDIAAQPPQILLAAAMGMIVVEFLALFVLKQSQNREKTHE